MLKGLQTLWNNTDVGSLAALESSAINCKTITALALLSKITSVGGAAGVSIKYAVSIDGTNFGGYDYTLVADTSGQTTPEGWNTVAVPDWAPYIKIKVTELKSLADTKVSASLYYRQTQGKVEF